MKRRILARVLIGGMVLTACGLIVGCGSIRWETSYDQGMREAMQKRQRVLLQFASSMNADCREMDADVFPDPEVERLMRSFVPVRLDTVLDRELAKHLGVREVPAFYVIRTDGQVVGSHIGKLDAEKFRAFLIKYRFN